MFGGRQTAALWGSFALGCLLVALLERPLTGSSPRQMRVDSAARGHLSVEGMPLTGLSAIQEQVTSAAVRWGLDPALVLAVVEAESCEQSDAVSPKGAVGLMQVLPETAAEIGLTESADAADPARNLEAGCHYLSSLLQSFGGDVELALAAYNAGPGAVRTWGTVPPYRETREYIARVGAVYQRLTGLDLAGATRFTTDPSALL